jgi:hypothetical protein
MYIACWFAHGLGLVTNTILRYHDCSSSMRTPSIAHTVYPGQLSSLGSESHIHHRRTPTA